MGGGLWGTLAPVRNQVERYSIGICYRIEPGEPGAEQKVARGETSCLPHPGLVFSLTFQGRLPEFTALEKRE